MHKPQVVDSFAIPSDASEASRQRALAEYRILDTPPEPLYDDLAALAAAICGTPLAAISFFDGKRQWFKAAQGADVESAPMDQSFCTYTTLDTQQAFTVVDAREDARFAGAWHVIGEPYFRAYAGAALVDAQQVPLGTICVFDVEPREFTSQQLDALRALSRQVMSLLDQRARLIELERQRNELMTLNAELDQFGYIVTHDLKAPLRQQKGFLDIIKEDHGESIPLAAKELLCQVSKFGEQADKILSEVGEYLHKSTLAGESIVRAPLREAYDSALELVERSAGAEVKFEASAQVAETLVPLAPLRHVLANLISNGLKYAGDQQARVHVHSEEVGRRLVISVTDNGPGIQDSERTRIFQLFGRGIHSGRAPGRGLGLAICQRLVLGLHGTLSVQNAAQGGACFQVSLPL